MTAPHLRAPVGALGNARSRMAQLNGYTSGLLIRRSRVRILPGAPCISAIPWTAGRRLERLQCLDLGSREARRDVLRAVPVETDDFEIEDPLDLGGVVGQFDGGGQCWIVRG